MPPLAQREPLPRPRSASLTLFNQKKKPPQAGFFMNALFETVAFSKAQLSVNGGREFPPKNLASAYWVKFRKT